MRHTYPIAPAGIFWTVQGEGALLGTPMRFLRLAGCSLGCGGCDTDYRVSERLTVDEIATKLDMLPWTRWVWITGGEPTDHDLLPLVEMLWKLGHQVALATAGVRHVDFEAGFLSVSPHFIDDRWVQRTGDQVNFVPGLDGLTIADIESVSVECSHSFSYRFITPLWDDGKVTNLAECVEFIQRHLLWRLGCQAHRWWRMP